MENTDTANDAKEKVSPISAENIVIITELAHIGLNSLKMQLPDLEEISKKEGSKITPEIYEHFKTLVDVGGDTVTHFSNMCQYLVDAGKKIEEMKNGGNNDEK